ncbi:MAG TPA: hypothetical protein VFC46_06225, partial [Humisphaera sp.]|nr:hypothetical protein [Humisphaera sp.]
MSLNNWIRAAGIEAGKNLISRSSAKRRANARGRDRRYRLSISGPIELLEGRLLLSSSVVPNSTQLPAPLASALLTDSPVLAEVGAVHD